MNIQEILQQAINIVKDGGIIIFPTDTAFGIGCRVDNQESIKRLFTLRKRPEEKATPVLVDTVKMAENYLSEPISEDVKEKLIEQYWPGALTIVLKCDQEKVPSLVRGGGDTIGVRIPNHSIPRSIVQGVGVPILGPSANFHRENTPYSFDDLNEELVSKVDYVIPGECSIKKASTVIDCTNKPWRILREGAIKPNL